MKSSRYSLTPFERGESRKDDPRYERPAYLTRATKSRFAFNIKGLEFG